jgi:hypothetical protein
MTYPMSYPPFHFSIPCPAEHDKPGHVPFSQSDCPICKGTGVYFFSPQDPVAFADKLFVVFQNMVARSFELIKGAK